MPFSQRVGGLYELLTCEGVEVQRVNTHAHLGGDLDVVVDILGHHSL